MQVEMGEGDDPVDVPIVFRRLVLCVVVSALVGATLVVLLAHSGVLRIEAPGGGLLALAIFVHAATLAALATMAARGWAMPHAPRLLLIHVAASTGIFAVLCALSLGAAADTYILEFFASQVLVGAFTGYAVDPPVLPL